MKVLKTPESQFQNLPGYPFLPNYVTLGDGLDMHYVDEGPSDGKICLLIHGQPSWSYLYRKMIPVLADAGFRVIVPDLIGFGRSDKLVDKSLYSYNGHVAWMNEFITKLDLGGIHLFCQDWGGLIGLRSAAELSERFDSIIAANTGLPNGQGKKPEAFENWVDFVNNTPDLPIGPIIQNATTTKLTPEEVAAYNAPFPDPSYKACAQVFPSLVPWSAEDDGVAENIAAWKVFSQWEKPFLTLFSDSDPITKGGERIFQKYVPGAKGQPHHIMENGGHFLQEDVGPELAERMIEFINQQ